MLSQKRLKECQLVGTLRSPHRFHFHMAPMPWLVVDETYTTGRLNQKLQQMSPVLDPELDVQVKMLCQILVINIYPNQTISKSAGLDAIAITPSRGPLWVAHYGCHWKMTTHTHITRYHRWRPGTVCPTSAVSGRVCRTCFPDSPGIWAERRIVSHLLINPAY